MRYVVLGTLLILLMAFAALFALSYVRHPAPAKPWPAGLGTLKDAAARYPAQPMSSGAAQLIAAARPLGLDLRPGRKEMPKNELGRRTTTRYVLSSIKATDETIPAPEKEIEELLRVHAADLERVRQLLLSGAPIAWPFDPASGIIESPNVPAITSLRGMLYASALDRARRGDGGAWDDLVH